jgi:glycosyltransferase involved in cell wall biosynthesis
MTIQPSSSPFAPAPRISAVMTAFNAAATIERALDSVLAERDIPLEIIVVDDASSDDSAAVVARVAAADPRVILVRAPVNEGVSKARNLALDVVRGDWLTFLDADDRLLPGAIAALMAPTQDPSVAVVVGQRIWTDGERTWRSKFYDIPDITEPGRKSLVTHPGLLYYASATGKAIHRSLTEDLRFEGRVLGDQPWTVRAMLRAGDAIEVIDTTVYEWTRPTAEHYFSTISADKKRSAALAAEAAKSARVCLLEVYAGIDADIPDAADRQALRAVYFDRLLRADLAAPLTSALKRHDPTVGVLFQALAAYFAAAPPDVLAASEPVVRDALVPVRRAWSWLPASGRDGYWAMVRVVARVDHSLARRVGGGWANGVAFRLVTLVPGRAGTTIATAVLRTGGVARRVKRRLRPA